MMNDSKLEPLFGGNIDPSADDPQEPFRRAKTADEHGLDLITIQDHPYNRNHFDTWTLLTALAMETRRVHIGTNVANTPLRRPSMLAKMAATLDILSGGRLELGMGAGGYWRGMAAYGLEKRSPKEAVDAFEDALHIVRGMFENAGGSFSYEGKYYNLQGARPGPGPAHPIRIWTGAYGDRMLNLTGRLGDGWLVSSTYLQPEGVGRSNRLIDEGAQQAGRSPSEIRRGYNLMGVIDLGRPETRIEQPEPGQYTGDVQTWVENLVRLYKDYRLDTFIYWPIAGDERLQIEVFAKEVVPQARETILSGGD